MSKGNWSGPKLNFGTGTDYDSDSDRRVRESDSDSDRRVTKLPRLHLTGNRADIQRYDGKDHLPVKSEVTGVC